MGWDVIVEASVIVPCYDDGARVPVGAVHHRIHKGCDIVHSTVAACRWVFAWCLASACCGVCGGCPASGDDPGDRGEGVVAYVVLEVSGIFDVSVELGGVLLEVVEERENIPNGGFGGVGVPVIPSPCEA